MAPTKKAAKAPAAPKEEDFIEMKKKDDEDEEESSEGEDEDEESEEEEGEEDAEAEAPEEAKDGEEKPAKAPKTKADRLKKMQEKAEKEGDEEPSEPRGVIYIGHIPQGFFEPQMKTFFDQFGTITRIRISRSKKNGAMKGYGFVEFEEESVAKIVADTMHKYLLFGKQLVCHIVPPEKQHKALFKGWKKGLRNRSNIRRTEARSLHNDRPTIATADGSLVAQTTRRQGETRNRKEKKLRLTLEAMGIDFDPNAASGGQRASARKPKKDKEAAAALAATAAAVAANNKVAKDAAPAKAAKTSPVQSPKAAPAKVEEKKRKQAPEEVAAPKAAKGAASKTPEKGAPLKKKAKKSA